MKILVSDYDKTFYTDEENIKINIEKVNQFMKTNLFVINTGRSYLDFKKKEEIYNIKYNYLVINHGASIIKNNQIIYNTPINNNIKKQIINDLDVQYSTEIFTCSGLESRLTLENDNLTKIHIKYKNEEKAKQIYNKIINKYGNFVVVYLISKGKGIEIVSKNANKGIATKEIAKLENIKKENIYTIGDDASDLEMIKNFKGYAVKNATDEIKKYALKEFDNVYELIDLI